MSDTAVHLEQEVLPEVPVRHWVCTSLWGVRAVLGALAFTDSADADPFRLEEPGLFACYQAAASGVAVSAERVGQPVLRLLFQSPQEPDRSTEDQRAREPVAEALGVNLYARQLVDGRDRPQLENLLS